MHHGWIVLAMIAGIAVGISVVAGVANSGAAADGAVACLRRTGRRTGGGGEVLHARIPDAADYFRTG